MRINLLGENNNKANALTVFVVTALFCFIGGHLRMPQELSLFWPVNALLAGMIVRFPFLHRSGIYLISYLAMVLNDLVFSGWASQSFTINFANIIFIFIVASLLIKHSMPVVGLRRPGKALQIFPACLLGSLLSATWGTLAEGATIGENFLPVWSDWVSEQFSTGVLLLPFLLTLPARFSLHLSSYRLKKLLPAVAVMVSIIAAALIDGAGSLTFPLPALIWCAIVYPITVTSLITLITGVTEIVLVVNGVMNIQGNDELLAMSYLVSARLGIATVAISPLIVAVSMDAILQLNKQLALRANYDFLTRLLSRSGMYEQLRQMDDSAPGNLHSAGVMLVDIDYFKAINDSFGHDSGDAVLEEIASRMRSVIGDQGMLCRFGGEEFVVVFFNHERAALFQIAEQIRHAIIMRKFLLQGNTVGITVSIGIASKTRPETNRVETVNALISAADKRLYHSKRNGRNQTSPLVETESEQPL
ncbi:GGDEF domain-containing protein [Winslowiella iniecta]|uniref:diguanylate cyclase n=1 Tax=Winslowiella iniecta TaxID=1560201 RepID=A0A0L7T311_9GAMM|nr:GGDEF domain-containing protein [Winslowiella iniecta]KOC87350.1 diguanylate cyclase [Winslowiella iniecta]KOC89799.1 diguanylate cyclase [Winslowiella iniecta]